MITQNFYSIPLYPILFCPDLSDPLEVNYNLSALNMSLAVKTGTRLDVREYRPLLFQDDVPGSF